MPGGVSNGSGGSHLGQGEADPLLSGGLGLGHDAGTSLPGGCPDEGTLNDPDLSSLFALLLDTLGHEEGAAAAQYTSWDQQQQQGGLEHVEHGGHVGGQRGHEHGGHMQHVHAGGHVHMQHTHVGGQQGQENGGHTHHTHVSGQQGQEYTGHVAELPLACWLGREGAWEQQQIQSCAVNGDQGGGLPSGAEVDPGGMAFDPHPWAGQPEHHQPLLPADSRQPTTLHAPPHTLCDLGPGAAPPHPAGQAVAGQVAPSAAGGAGVGAGRCSSAATGQEKQQQQQAATGQEQQQQQLQAATGQEQQQQQQQADLIPLGVQAGCLYCVYCLHTTQLHRPPLPVYLPLELLQLLLQLLPVLRGAGLWDCIKVVQVRGQQAKQLGVCESPRSLKGPFTSRHVVQHPCLSPHPPPPPPPHMLTHMPSGVFTCQVQHTRGA